MNSSVLLIPFLVVPSVLSANREVWKVEELRMESHRIAG